jgi:hypothetical protein
MAERVTSNSLIIIFTAIIVIFSIIVLIQQVEANLMFWILRPSESTALDIVSKFTALGGTTGKVITDYRNITNNIHYYVYNSGKIVCVISIKEEKGVLPLKTINCYSTPYEVNIQPQQEEYGESFHLCFQKDYNEFTDNFDVLTWWEDLNVRCS